MSAPAKDPLYRATDSAATLGHAVRVVGRIESNEDLYIEGQVEGEVHVPGHRLTVGPKGSVHADIRALEVVSLGAIHGSVEADGKIEFRKSSTHVGDIRTARLIVEEGARLNGTIEMNAPARAAKPDEAVDFDLLGRAGA